MTTARGPLAADNAIRAQDYLNDKIQTPADLENIDSLLSDVKAQQELLKQQLRDAETALGTAKRTSHEQRVLALEKAQSFSRRQADFDKRLLTITNAESSDQAAREFEESIEKLQNLDVAVGYIELLKTAEDLSGHALQEVSTSTEVAIQYAERLHNISQALKSLQPAAEGAAPHLIDHVSRASATLWRGMKDKLSAEFEKLLRQMKWPSKEVDFQNDRGRNWAVEVEQLLLLQDAELASTGVGAESRPVASIPVVLLPLEVMVKPLEVRFRYHFEGDRPTNRLDKPEYFLSHVTDQLNVYAPLICGRLQSVLQTTRHKLKTNSPINETDATSALITALLPMLRRKIFVFLPQVSSQPQLLSHFIHELIDFDAVLRDEWGYDPTNRTSSWKGLTWEVLVEKEWFGRWLEVEKNFALSRYQNIIDSKDAGEIDYDSVEPKSTKPTKAAIRVTDLLETVSDRYRPLGSFSQKIRFLIDVQLAIFDKYHSRLYSGLEAYLAATSAVVRAVQGSGRDDKMNVEGIRGLERLCRIYGSAVYIERALENWSDDVFFLELWDELQNRARARQTTGQNLAGPLTVEDVAERTSSAVGSDEDSGAVFDEIARAYRKLRDRAEVTILEHLIKNMRDAIRPYSKINPWSLLEGNSTHSNDTSTSAELDGLLEFIHTYLSFLARAITPTRLRHISRQLSLSIQSYVWDYILLRHTFSSHGAEQFRRDMIALWQAMDFHLGSGQGELGMKKVSEAAVLLTLPQEAPEDGGLALSRVEEEVFSSNDRARQVLDGFGLVVLTETEARNILTRRIELAG